MDHLGFPTSEPSDSAAHGEQEVTVVGFHYGLDRVGLVGYRIKFRRTGLPSPQAVHYPSPEVSFAVLMQTEYSKAEGAVLTVTLNAPGFYFAEPPSGSPTRAGPYRTFAILKQGKNVLSSKLRILSELAVLPTCQPLPGTDPKSSVACSQQPQDEVGRERLIRRRLPRHNSY